MEHETQYPVLVYGTLRPGGGNYNYFLDGYTTSEENIRIDGFTMFGQSGYPYLALGNNTITATLVTIEPDVYDRIMRGLDSLEGYRGEGNAHNHYDRVLHTFTWKGVERKAWIYVAINDYSVRLAHSLPVIASGDWIKHVTHQYS